MGSWPVATARTTTLSRLYPQWRKGTTTTAKPRATLRPFAFTRAVRAATKIPPVAFEASRGLCFIDVCFCSPPPGRTVLRDVCVDTGLERGGKTLLRARFGSLIRASARAAKLSLKFCGRLGSGADPGCYWPRLISSFSSW